MSTWTKPLAFVYGIGARLYHWPYDYSLRKARMLPVPVLSVGNISMGGTGKTPMVRLLCGEAVRRGYRPAVLTRGYGGKQSGVVLNGRVQGSPARAADYGDEPVLLSRSLENIPILVSPHRYEIAMEYLAAGGDRNLFILDDGFQHRGLHRDVDLVLLDPNTGLTNGNLVPHGTLREPVQALTRADCLLVLGTQTPEPLDAIPPDLPLFRGSVIAQRLTPVVSGPAPGVPSDLQGRRIRGVCGIANPKRFRETLSACGADVVGWAAYRDHHAFTVDEIRQEEGQARADDAQLVTTEKDALRIEPRARATWWALGIEVILSENGNRLLDLVFEFSGKRKSHGS